MLSYFLPHTNITIPSEAQILFNDLYMRQLWNMLYNAGNVLSKELTQSVPNFASFPKLLKEFHFLKRASIIYLNFIPNYCPRCLKTLVKPKYVNCMRRANIKCSYWYCITEIKCSCRPFWKRFVITLNDCAKGRQSLVLHIKMDTLCKNLPNKHTLINGHGQQRDMNSLLCVPHYHMYRPLRVSLSHV